MFAGARKATRLPLMLTPALRDGAEAGVAEDAVPTRTMVAPSSMATSKSPLIP